MRLGDVADGNGIDESVVRVLFGTELSNWVSILSSAPWLTGGCCWSSVVVVRLDFLLTCWSAVVEGGL